MALTRDDVRDLHSNLQEALNTFGEWSGFKITVGRATYGQTSVTLKIECVQLNDDGEPEADRAGEVFKARAHRYGLKPEHLNQVFKSAIGTEYKLVGLNPKAQKFPIKAVEVSTGKAYKFPASVPAAYFRNLEQKGAQ